MTRFDPVEPIEPGITVIEASAGTGKTHAVSSIVVREVATGPLRLDQILVVTFTRKATSSLRERVWKRLTEAVDSIDSGGANDGSDPVMAHLRDAPPDEVASRRQRLVTALSEFDRATIATTHGFAQQMLAGLGVAGDYERDVEVVEEIDDLVHDAVHDLFVRRFFDGTRESKFGRSEAMAIARAVVANPDAHIAEPDPDHPGAHLRHKFATTLRERVELQKRAARLVTYDDLLGRLRNSIEDPELGGLVVARLRDRFRMAIVDEFQDTDTVQWRILQKAFAEPPSRLVLVGDPKQAIYAFRGGDVHAYLEATAGARKRTLDVSWRADQPLLDGFDAFFGDAQLGDPTISAHRLEARPGASRSRLIDGGSPFTIRLVPTVAVTGRAKGYVLVNDARPFVAKDLANEVARLTKTAKLVEDDGRRRPVRPGDIAVLVRRRADATVVAGALRRAGVGAVVHTGHGIYASEAAGRWLELLSALEVLSATGRVHAVALGPFIGWSAEEVALATEDEWETVDERLHDWAAAFRARGIAGLLRRIETTSALTARVLGEIGGERLLSDLRLVAELLHARVSAHPSSLSVLAAWLSERIADAHGANGREGDPTRLESDADAVTVLTIHTAKGLEYPIVLLPSAWEKFPFFKDQPQIFHDADGRRCISVCVDGPSVEQQFDAAIEEQAGEDLRLLYVAMTRAKHRVVAWWVTGKDSDESAFARVLVGAEPSGHVPRRVPVRANEHAVRDAAAARGSAIDVVEVEVAPSGPAGSAHLRLVPDDEAALTVRRFGRDFDRTWMRTSYSGLTAAAHDVARPLAPGVLGVADDELDDEHGPQPPVDATEESELAKLDEPLVAGAEPVDDGAAPEASPPLLLGALPGGARVGTMVHEMLEGTAFDAPDLALALRAAAHVAGADRLVEGHVDALGAGLAAALATPLGPAFDGLTLAGVKRADRLDELAFDLALAGGDRPTGTVSMPALAAVFARLPGDDAVAGYHERLEDPLLTAAVRGYLSGSIDLVVRHGGRYVVADYKTNRLAPPSEELTVWHYRPAAMKAAMFDAHYPLQAALYAVALHRYLRWRVPGYDPAQHLGGIAYLFLRGMTGPDVPCVDGAPCGVFAWTPPASFVTGLSDVLHRGEP